MLLSGDFFIIVSNYMTNFSLLKIKGHPRVLVILQVHPELKNIEKHCTKLWTAENSFLIIHFNIRYKEIM